MIMECVFHEVPVCLLSFLPSPVSLPPACLHPLILSSPFVTPVSSLFVCSRQVIIAQ